MESHVVDVDPRPPAAAAVMHPRPQQQLLFQHHIPTPSSPAAAAAPSPPFCLLHQSSLQDAQEQVQPPGGGGGAAATTSVPIQDSEAGAEGAEEEDVDELSEEKNLDLLQQEELEEEQRHEYDDLKQEEEQQEGMIDPSSSHVHVLINQRQQEEEAELQGSNDNVNNRIAATDDLINQHRGQHESEQEHELEIINRQEPHYMINAAMAAPNNQHAIGNRMNAGQLLQLHRELEPNHDQQQQQVCSPYQLPFPSPHHQILLCRSSSSSTTTMNHAAAVASAAGFSPTPTNNCNSSFASRLIHVPSAIRPAPMAMATTTIATTPILPINIHPLPVFAGGHGVHNPRNQQNDIHLNDHANLTLVSGSHHPHPSDFVTCVAMDSPSPAADIFKRKRGRPRKLLVDGTGSAASSSAAGLISAAAQVSLKRGVKKARMMNAAAAAAVHAAAAAASDAGVFKAHVIDIAAGEDVLVRIMSFLEQVENLQQGMCILSANGAISNVALTSGGGGAAAALVTYEGRFEILSLAGSFPPADINIYGGTTRGAAAALTVSLGGANGHIVGGEVAGVFVAASPVKVVVATFLSSEARDVVPNEEENQQWHMQPITENFAASAADRDDTSAAFCSLSHVVEVQSQEVTSAHGQSPAAGVGGGGEAVVEQQQEPPPSNDYRFPNTIVYATTPV